MTWTRTTGAGAGVGFGLFCAAAVATNKVQNTTIELRISPLYPLSARRGPRARLLVFGGGVQGGEGGFLHAGGELVEEFGDLVGALLVADGALEEDGAEV